MISHGYQGYNSQNWNLTQIEVSVIPQKDLCASNFFIKKNLISQPIIDKCEENIRLKTVYFPWDILIFFSPTGVNYYLFLHICTYMIYYWYIDPRNLMSNIDLISSFIKRLMFVRSHFPWVQQSSQRPFTEEQVCCPNNPIVIVSKNSHIFQYTLKNSIDSFYCDQPRHNTQVKVRYILVLSGHILMTWHRVTCWIKYLFQLKLPPIYHLLQFFKRVRIVLEQTLSLILPCPFFVYGMDFDKTRWSCSWNSDQNGHNDCLMTVWNFSPLCMK